MEHSPNGLESVLRQLQAVAAYPSTPVVRVPIGDVVTIKQVLDLGAQNLLVPMISSADEAAAGGGCRALSATRAPRRRIGTRTVGTMESCRRLPAQRREHVSLFVQIETTAGVDAAAEIAAVDGVDGVFVGPSDLAASMGLIGQQSHPDVAAAVLRTFEAVRAAGKPVGVNAFDPAVARRYLAAGARLRARRRRCRAPRPRIRSARRSLGSQQHHPPARELLTAPAET